MPFLAARPENQVDSAGLSKIPPNIAEQRKAPASDWLADTKPADAKPVQLDTFQEKAKAIQIVLTEALNGIHAKFPVMVPQLGKIFKHYDTDDAETPEDLMLIWEAKGGADTQAIRYIAHFIENDPDAAKVIAAFNQKDNFKAKLNALYDSLPKNSAAFDLEIDGKVSKQLKAYLVPQGER